MRASAVLSAEAKLVWMEDWTLDRGGEGCWLSHDQMGERLGMTGHAVQYHRTRLEALGLYQRLKRPGARSPGWRPIVPSQCLLRTQRPTPIEVDRARTFLDLALRGKDPTARLSGPGDQTLKVRRPDIESLPVRVSTRLSTAFDSQTVKQPSTALDVEGNGVSACAPESKAIEGGDLPQSVLPSNGQPSSEIEIDSQPRALDQRPSDEVFEEKMATLHEKRLAYQRERDAERQRKAGTA